jgi:hypothetical protein
MPEWLTPALVVAFACGGLGGAVFTWWVKRDPVATVSYGRATASTGTHGPFQSLIPNLSMRIGERNVPVVHLHGLEFTVVKGFSQAGKVAILFNEAPEVFGTALKRPSPLHSAELDSVPGGFVLTMSPLDKATSFQVTIATDSEERPTVTTAGRDLQPESLARRPYWRTCL